MISTPGRARFAVYGTLAAGSALLLFYSLAGSTQGSKVVVEMPDAITGVGAKYAPDYHIFDLDEHMTKRKHCHWVKLEQMGGPVDGFTHLTYEQRQAKPIDPFLDEQYASFQASRSYLLEYGPWRCTWQEEDGSFTFIERHGPFATVGGEDWVSMWFSDLGGLSELPEDLYIKKGSFTAMTNFASEVKPQYAPRPDDVPVPHPPINPHHWHLNTGMNWDHRNEGDQYVMYQAHSDNSQCKSKEFLGCQGFDFTEPGVAFPVKRDQRGKNMIFTTGSWLDVRKPNSPEMYHWLEFTATVTTKRPLATVDTFAIIGVPWPMGLSLTLPKEEYLAYRNDRKWVEHFNEMLFRIPSQGEAVFWTTMQGTASSSACATINSWRWHQHGRAMMKDMYLMRGTGGDLGLTALTDEVHVEVYTGMYQSGPPGTGVSLAPHNLTISSLQANLKASGNYVCEFPLTHPDKWEHIAADTFWPGVRDKEYPRHVKATCPAVTLYPGDALTIVSFWDPPKVSGIDVAYSGLMTGQHGMLEAYQFNSVCNKKQLQSMPKVSSLPKIEFKQAAGW